MAQNREFRAPFVPRIFAPELVKLELMYRGFGLCGAALALDVDHPSFTKYETKKRRLLLSLLGQLDGASVSREIKALITSLKLC